MKRAILAAGAAILVAPAIPGDAYVPNRRQKDDQPEVRPAFSIHLRYVVSGQVIDAVDDEKPRSYRAGESWHELPGARHRVSRNASKTRPAKLPAIFVADAGERQLVRPALD